MFAPNTLLYQVFCCVFLLFLYSGELCPRTIRLPASVWVYFSVDLLHNSPGTSLPSLPHWIHWLLNFITLQLSNDLTGFKSIGWEYFFISTLKKYFPYFLSCSIAAPILILPFKKWPFTLWPFSTPRLRDSSLGSPNIL